MSKTADLEAIFNAANINDTDSCWNELTEIMNSLLEKRYIAHVHGHWHITDLGEDYLEQLAQTDY